MNLLEFSKATVEKFDSITDGTFATTFMQAKSEYYTKYANNIICSNSHGISFFENVIKFWDNPDSYYQPKDKKGNPIDPAKKEIPKDDYEYNFIRVLKFNKERNEKT